MAIIHGRMEFPDHMHPGQSGKADGALSHLLYGNDSGKLEAHGDFFPDTGDGSDSPSNENAPIPPQLALALIGAAAGIIGTKVASGIKNRLKAKRSKRDGAVGHSGNESQAVTAELVTMGEHEPAGFSKEVDVAAEDRSIDMSNTEWQERFRAMLITGAFSKEQWRILSIARIEDTDDATLEAQSAMGTLAAQQFSDRLALVLATNPSVRDEETLAEFVEMLGKRRIVESEYLPARSEESKETLFLTDGDM